MLGALGEDPDGAGERRARVTGAPVVVGEGLHPATDRRRIEPSGLHRRHLGGKRAHGDLVAAAVQLVQDRDEREQVPAAGRGVGEDPGHQLPPVNGWSSSIKASWVWRRLSPRSWRSSFQVSTSVTAISWASLRARPAPRSPARVGANTRSHH